MVDILFTINDDDINISDTSKKYCVKNNNTEKTIEIYSNIDYTFKINTNSAAGVYYFMIFYNFEFYNGIETHSNNNDEPTYIDYLYGVKDKEENNDLKNIRFKLNSIEQNFTYILFKKPSIKNGPYENVLNGRLVINKPLEIINIELNNNLLTSDSIYVNIINNNIYSNNIYIILYENYNYLINVNILIYSDTTFNIYTNNIDNNNKILSSSSTNYESISTKNINYKNKFYWDIKNSESTVVQGNLYFDNFLKKKSNEEILYDFKFKNIKINQLLYNNFIYNEYLNIKYLNNITNYLSITDSHKFLIINNKYTNISIILPSINIRVGITYTILINKTLNFLNIYCEDNNFNLSNYDKIKGGLQITNLDNSYIKSITSEIEELTSTTFKTELSETVRFKSIDDVNYNGGLYKYGFMKIICSEYVNDKYIWNIEGNLVGNLVNKNNVYKYNPFL